MLYILSTHDKNAIVNFSLGQIHGHILFIIYLCHLLSQIDYILLVSALCSLNIKAR